MKKFFMVFVIIILFLPAYAEQDEIAASEADAKTRKTSAVKPKKEQQKTIYSNQKDLEKKKAQFQRMKERQLELLKEERDILEYSD